eukprot:TRINITY_DN31576_c0_g1_i1.p1 TRINITY_DN31576_c0_g1~~TRINITY_DN31576_c0_g1_i1.p1  ORF type:complete len:387 (+),score=48.70 TRINITY_DN31576_c0_g1_i1:58-1218(+)
MATSAVVDHYETLGVPRTATLADIRKAYRQKALKHHPDKDCTEGSTLMFQKIQRAYEALSSVRNRFVRDTRTFDDSRNEAARLKAARDRDLHSAQVQTQLLHACKVGDTWQTMKLLRGGCVEADAMDQNGHTALMIAAKGLNTQIVSLLLLYRADVNRAGASGWTPLLLAVDSSQEHREHCMKEDVSCVSQLLKAEANPNSQTAAGATALMLACATGSLAMTTCLLDHGADLDHMNDIGMTSLILAADGGYADVAQALLKASASVECADADGRTPLMCASLRAHSGLVNMFLDAGADPLVKDFDGCTALRCTVDRFWGDLALTSAPCDKEQALCVVFALLKARADLSDISVLPPALSLALARDEHHAIASHVIAITSEDNVAELGG